MCGAIFITLSIIKLHKDKFVSGINWLHPLFFLLWGVWNLFFYPHLSQWFSFAGGVAIAITNFIWVSQLIYYSRNGKHNG